eukprot:362156-Chlamydomonas_euryale.AAC.13
MRIQTYTGSGGGEDHKQACPQAKTHGICPTHVPTAWTHIARSNRRRDEMTVALVCRPARLLRHKSPATHERPPPTCPHVMLVHAWPVRWVRKPHQWVQPAKKEAQQQQKQNPVRMTPAQRQKPTLKATDRQDRPVPLKNTVLLGQPYG